MPILLGVFAALFIGISDTFGRASARRAEAVSHVATQMLVGTVVALPLTLVIASSFIGSDVLSGLVSGVLIAIGLSVVYQGMAEASSAVVAPIAAVFAAVLPLLWDMLQGASLSLTSGAGCALAILSLALTTFSPDLGDRIRYGLMLGITGGVFFGLSVIFVADTSEASGVWPAAAQRFSGFLAMILVTRQQAVPTLLKPPVLHFGILGGLTGALGMICWVIGSQQGDLGTVSVISSTYPAVVVLLASRFDDDHLRWWQAVGVVGAIVGTALIALG